MYRLTVFEAKISFPMKAAIEAQAVLRLVSRLFAGVTGIAVYLSQ